MKNYRTVLGVVAAAIVALVVAIAGRTMLFQGGATPSTAIIPQIGGAWTLVDHDGRTVTDQDFRGKYTLMFFGYTYCPDVCPTALSTISTAMEKLPKAVEAAIVPIFVSVDWERDKPEMLKDYVRNFHSRAIGMTGSEQQIREVAKLYRVYFAKAEQKEGPYLMDHSSIVYLMGPDGKFITHFSHTTTPEQMAETLAKTVKPASS